MGIFDAFKRKKTDAKTAEQAAPQQAASEQAAPKKRAPAAAHAERQRAAAAPVRDKTIRETLEPVRASKRAAVPLGTLSHRVLLRPVISEKTAQLHAMNQYVFRVAPDANKNDVFKAIVETYHAEPASVRIIRVSGKQVRRGRIQGRTRNYKKAVISMPKGVTLPVYEGV